MLLVSGAEIAPVGPAVVVGGAVMDGARREPSDLDGLESARGVEALSARLLEHVRMSERAARPAPGEGPHPLEFDDSGFPIPQRPPSFAERVGRLLGE